MGLSSCKFFACKERAVGYGVLDEVEVITTNGAKEKDKNNYVPILKYSYHLTLEKMTIHKEDFLEFDTQAHLLEYINYKKGDSIAVSYCVQKPTDTHVILTFKDE